MGLLVFLGDIGLLLSLKAQTTRFIVQRRVNIYRNRTSLFYYDVRQGLIKLHFRPIPGGRSAGGSNSQIPPVPVGPPDELIGVIEIGDLHSWPIP